ncbi:MAG: polymorphic toxin-type HINT domain-containing protein, partial [Streptosporangiaceae bacterium]
VWAISSAAHDHARADRLVSAGEHRGEPGSCPFCVSAACVAPEDDLAAAAASCGGMSFTPGTKVLLASGIAVPIASLKPGDKVLATNVRTRKTKAEPVAAVLVHHDTNRYDLTVKTAHGSAVVHTTSNHLFWDLTQRKWVKARALRYGDHLRTLGGHGPVTAAGGWTPRRSYGWMWDLSVPGNGDHDFYIDVADTGILVHNCPVPAGFVTAPDQAVFWSGIRGGDTAAATWAAKNGGTTLETTMAARGITLPAWDASNPAAVAAWRQASEAFARSASGNVTVLQETGVRVNSVWAQVEYPALIANRAVTSITSINPVTGDSIVLWSRP